MLSLVNKHVHTCEHTLLQHLSEVVQDLRMLEAGDLLAWLHGHRLGNIAAIVASSTEASFKPGTLRFSLAGSAELTWAGQIRMRIDMEFHHADVDCYFRLHLENASSRVGITYLTIDGRPCLSAQTAARFIALIADARVMTHGRRGRVSNAGPIRLTRPASQCRSPGRSRRPPHPGDA